MYLLHITTTVSCLPLLSLHRYRSRCACSAVQLCRCPVRFRSLRVLALTALTFAALTLQVPTLGFNIAEDCLNDYRDSALAEIDANGGSAFLYNPDNGKSGRCGPVAWHRTVYDDSHGTLSLPGAGGILGQEGMVWGPDITTCQDTGIYQCIDLRELGSGWFMYSRYNTSN